ncbi:hypothetical protein BESB_036200 [Besnoitia besnoiti]|uniref:Uncharacterized protein n=1 Tax=Besnoitia besnoiti TaxID=94643 RepID=A0A2A9MND4_BESBE|nr:hypothetical protein BESB_036200 [Besnoitia besnoiti]PFH37162.1 hypothetical protein BESB_036200 [Besnoitia besnoiti]
MTEIRGAHSPLFGGRNQSRLTDAGPESKMPDSSHGFGETIYPRSPTLAAGFHDWHGHPQDCHRHLSCEYMHDACPVASPTSPNACQDSIHISSGAGRPPTGDANPATETSEADGSKSIQQFFWPTFACPLPTMSTNDVGFEGVADARSDASKATPEPGGIGEEKESYPSTQKRSAQMPNSPGSSVLAELDHLLDPSRTNNTDSVTVAAPDESGADCCGEEAFFGMMGGVDPQKPHPCIVLRGAFEKMRTGTRLSFEASEWDNSCVESISGDPISTSAREDNISGDHCTLSSFLAFQRHPPAGNQSEEQRGFTTRGSLDQNATRLQLSPDRGRDGDTHPTQQVVQQRRRLVPGTKSTPSSLNAGISQEVQTRSRGCGSDTSLQAVSVTADAKTQTRRTDKCHRGVQCGSTRIASLAFDELTKWHAELLGQLKLHTSAAEALTHKLLDEQRQKESGFQHLERSKMTAEELQGALQASSSSLADVRAELQSHMQTIKRLTEEGRAAECAHKTEKQCAQREHELLACALQAQLKHVTLQLEQLEEERRLEVNRHVRKTQIAKQQAEELDQQYTARILHLQAECEARGEAIKQAQSEILALRKEMRTKDSQHAQALHDIEYQKEADLVQSDAVQKRSALSLEKELLRSRLEADRLRVQLVGSQERLNAAHQIHRQEIHALKKDHESNLQQVRLEHKQSTLRHQQCMQELREMAALGKEELASGLDAQMQLWRDKTAELQEGVDKMSSKNIQSARTIQELMTAVASYKQVAEEMQAQLRNLTVADKQREVEAVVLRREREDLLQALQTSAAEHQAFREQALSMKNRLLRAVADKDDALRQAEACLADDIAISKSISIHRTNSITGCDYPAREATHRSYKDAVSPKKHHTSF